MTRTPELDFIEAIRTAPTLLEALRVYQTKHPATHNEQTLRPLSEVAKLFGNELAMHLTPSNEAMKAVRFVREAVADTLTTERDAAYTLLREQITTMKGVYSAKDAIEKALSLLDTIYGKTHTV